MMRDPGQGTRDEWGSGGRKGFLQKVKIPVLKPPKVPPPVESRASSKAAHGLWQSGWIWTLLTLI